MATDLVNSATSEKLVEVDWTKNIEICELVARDQRQAKDVVKAIKKRLESKNATTQLYAVMLLEMLMNNIGEHIYRQVIDTGVLPILVKIVKKKSDLPVRERIFLLLDATQTSLGGASGKFPQYYSAYYDLVSAGVQFPQRPSQMPSSRPIPETNKKSTLNAELAVSRHNDDVQPAEPRIGSESSIIQKASNALEVLTEVLDAVDSQTPEGAKDEFTLDLLEQCSFQKQRVMHLVMTCRDEKVVSRAIELNEKLQSVLARHDALLNGRSPISDRTTSSSNHFNHEDTEEEEEVEQLFRRRNPEFSRGEGTRIPSELSARLQQVWTSQLCFVVQIISPLHRLRKGKACARPEDDGNSEEHIPLGLLGSSNPGERLNRPLIRPLPVEQSHEPSAHFPRVRPLSSEEVHMAGGDVPAAAIPPPPAKHQERERFFQEKKGDVSGHMRGLSLHSRNASSSRSGSIDFSD